MIPSSLAGGAVGIDFKGSPFEREIMLWGMRWYVGYPIGYHQFAEWL